MRMSGFFVWNVGAQATGGPCIRGFEDGVDPSQHALRTARRDARRPAAMIPFRRRSGRSDLANRSACPPVASRATLTPGYPSAYRCALRTLPGRRKSASIGNRPAEPGLRSKYRMNPKVAEILTIAPARTYERDPDAPMVPTQSPPPRPRGLRRYGFPRSHGPAERRVTGQWLMLGCCADPGPNRTAPAERTGPRMEIPNEPERCRNSGKQSQNLLRAPHTCPTPR